MGEGNRVTPGQLAAVVDEAGVIYAESTKGRYSEVPLRFVDLLITTQWSTPRLPAYILKPKMRYAPETMQ
jgi:hypothetical protein